MCLQRACLFLSFCHSHVFCMPCGASPPTPPHLFVLFCSPSCQANTVHDLWRCGWQVHNEGNGCVCSKSAQGFGRSLSRCCRGHSQYQKRPILMHVTSCCQIAATWTYAYRCVCMYLYVYSHMYTCDSMSVPVGMGVKKKDVKKLAGSTSRSNHAVMAHRDAVTCSLPTPGLIFPSPRPPAPASLRPPHP